MNKIGKYRFISNWLQTRNIFLSHEEIKLLMPLTTFKNYDRYEHLMLQEERVEKLYFLNKGIVRLYRIFNKQDYTLGFVSSNDFVSTPLYVFSQDKSPCALESLTPLEVLEWNRDDLVKIKEKLPKVELIELAIMERVFSWVQLIQIETKCLSAEEHYKKLIETQPEILLHVPLKYIASFLGIHTDSLSRIRKKIV